MNDRRTVVATTTRTRRSLEEGAVRVDVGIQLLSATLRGAVRYGLPAGLADGLELRSVRRSPRDRLAPDTWVPRAPPPGSTSACTSNLRPSQAGVNNPAPLLGTF